MVKVFPSNFTFFESQNIFTPSGEPLAITCSNDCLFIAVDGCMIEVYKLNSLEPVAQFRTVDLVHHFEHSTRGDCILALERKHLTSHGFARVYFQWRGSSIDKPVRVSMMQSLSEGVVRGQDRIAAEIVELPTDSNSVTCLSCCSHTGRIAVGMGSTIRVFTLEIESGCEEASPDSELLLTHNIETLLDIRTGVPLKKIAIFDEYVAFGSGYEVQVVKVSLLGEARGSITNYKEEEEERGSTNQISDEIPKDPTFFSWSPSVVWDVERTTSATTSAEQQEVTHVTSHDQPRPPLTGTLTLASISRAASRRTSRDKQTEVLGPVECVWGHPLHVTTNNSSGNSPVQCQVLTMLYRRFSPLSGSGEGRWRTATLPSRASRQHHLGARGEEEGGVHSIQLIPTLVEDNGSRVLVGLCCFLANKYHGFLYDVHQRTRLISSFSFMSKSQLVVCDSGFLHALSADSIESYTTRVFQAVTARMPTVGNLVSTVRGGEGEESLEDFKVWLKQPCPPPSMDLMLVSSNKFIGSCCLATSRDHMVVLTKSEKTTQQTEAPTTTSSWLMHSLSLRRPQRPPVEPSWNIYVLRKKDISAFYQQFMEFAMTLKDSSPPMYQHVLSEAHVLARNELLQCSQSRRQLAQTLRESTRSLAEAVCAYSTSKAAVTSAAKYFVLSGSTVADVVQYITTTYPSPANSPTPYSVLMEYLNLVLFEKQNAANQAELLLLQTDKVLELYVELEPKHFTDVLMYSWLAGRFSATVLEVIEHFLQKAENLEERQLGYLCEAMVLVQLGRQTEAKKKILQVPEEILIGWMQKNVAFVIDTAASEKTHLGKVIVSVRESCFLELVSHCLASEQLDFETICTVLGAQIKESLADNVLLKQFLERIILEQVEVKRPAVTTRAVLLLADILFARLSSPHPPRPSPSAPFGLYGSRYKWLESTPPFNSAGTGTTPTQNILQDLMQLQALLCSHHMTAEVANHIEAVLAENGDGVTGGLSLKILTWPHTGKMSEAVKLVLDCCPSVTVEYCLAFFDSGLEQWRSLLDLLLLHSQQERESGLTQTYHTLYKGALAHVVTLTTPEEFLSLLPPNGSLDFFLPFIEHSCKLFVANQVAGQLHTSHMHH